MKDRQPIRTARRSARYDERERLGLAQTLCVLCIEDHHTLGRNHDSKLTAPLCKKHHGHVHELMLRAGISLRHQRNPVTRVAMALRAMAAYRHAEADAMGRLADLLEKTGGQSK
jgi:hypothetical protein